MNFSENLNKQNMPRQPCMNMVYCMSIHIIKLIINLDHASPFLPATTTCDPSFDILKELRAPSTLQHMVEKLKDPPPTPEKRKEISSLLTL